MYKNAFICSFQLLASKINENNKEINYESYFGYDNESNDIDFRIDILKNAIKQAHKIYTDSKNMFSPNEDLCVFVVPEFFFRGKYGLYNDFKYPSYILEKMFDLVKEEKYKNWLFVYGTIPIWYEFENKTKKTNEIPHNKILNCALIQTGGKMLGPELHVNSTVIYKQNISAIDYPYLRPECDPLLKLASHYRVPNSYNNGRERAANDCYFHKEGILRNIKSHDFIESEEMIQDDQLFDNSILKIDNLYIGLEVCLDHNYGRLKKIVSKIQRDVDIHIIISCGGSLDKNNIGCHTHGALILCDGNDLNNNSFYQNFGSNWQEVMSHHTKKEITLPDKWLYSNYPFYNKDIPGGNKGQIVCNYYKTINHPKGNAAQHLTFNNFDILKWKQ